TEEKRLRDDLARLQALKQQEQSRLQNSQQRRHTPLERALAQLCRQSLLGGHVRIALKTPHVALRAHETVRWQSAGCKWRLRSAQGTPYWDREAQGTLVVTSERILFDPAQGNLWQHSLKKLRGASPQRLQDTTGLALQFEDLQKPVGFSAEDMTVELKLN